MFSPRNLISRRAFLAAVLAACPGWFSLARNAPAPTPLNVVLIAGIKNDAYDNEPSLKRVQEFLEKGYVVKCSWVTPEADGKSFKNLAALEKADVAVLFARRMTIPASQLDQIKRFCESGKGLVGLRTATHAWNEWPTFDVDVIGAKYGMHFGRVKTLAIKPHDVTRRATGFQTTSDMYKYENLSSEVTILMEGTNEKGTMPAAWVRESPKGRVFYLGFGSNAEFEKPVFLQLIADGVLWSAKKRTADYQR